MFHIYKNEGRDLTTTYFFNVVPMLKMHFVCYHTICFIPSE